MIQMMKKTTIAIALLAMGLVGSGGAETGRARPDLIASMDWLQAHLNDPTVAVITTGGNRDAFDKGHIPGARFLPHDATVDEHHARRPPAEIAAALARAGATDHRRIVIYGDDALSTGWLFMLLDAIGHGDHVAMLDGNLAAWREGGRPVSTEPSTAATGTLTPRPRNDVTVDADWVRARLSAPEIRLLDVRSERERQNGYLEATTLVLWQDLYADVAARRFKDPAAMRQVFERAGVKPGQTVVTYCAVGMRASLLYFAARRLGIPARVYEGSWHDWTARGYPTVRN
jgi:thiosulfate/3-mercaptopyruvate sulfurtransferase